MVNPFDNIGQGNDWKMSKNYGRYKKPDEVKKKSKILEDLVSPDTNSPLREYVKNQNNRSNNFHTNKPSMLNLFP